MTPLEKTADEIPPASLDISANRSQRKYSRKENLARIIWTCCRPLFCFSPRPLYRWRAWLLRRFGAIVGNHVQISNSADIFAPWRLAIGDYSSIGNRAIVYNLANFTIGKNVTISQGAHLCGGSHDYNDPAMRLIKGNIDIADDAWICADAFIGPNITIGNRAIVAARAVVVSSVAESQIVGGNPARVIKHRK